MESKDIKKTDIEVLKYQLSSKNIFLDRVLERCEYGYPRIIFLNPLIVENNQKKLNYQFLSNLIWLTCPYLNAKIHELESGGYITKISHFIGSERKLKFLMKEAHVNYYFLKKAIYNSILGTWDDCDINKLKLDTGIGGIRDISKLKCLHLHYAHYRICDKNIAGKVVSQILNGDINCKQVDCKNAGCKY